VSREPYKILITAGGGFIARNLREKLSPKYSVVSCNSRELDLLDSERVFKYIKDDRFDVVIHTATHDPAPKGSTKDPAKVLQNNLAMFFNVARCREYFGKMLFFGSGADFDRQHWVPGMGEGYFDQNVPADQYGFSKYIMTRFAQSNSGIYALRIFSVFGKYEDWRYRFISRACCQAVLGMPITVTQNARYDFLYVDDLARIVTWFIEGAPKRSVYNVCAGRTHDYRELAGMVRKISGKDIDIMDMADEPLKEYGGDNSLLLSEMKDFEFSPIERSIGELYRWYDANRQIIDKREL
jgi:GDP-L-fucose synthase